MQLSDHHIDEFIVLYKKHYGVVLDRALAIEKGLELCRLIKLVDFESAEMNKDLKTVNENEYVQNIK